MQREKVKKISVGIIGCGLISQVMHLPHLREMREHFHVYAVCDLSRETVEHVANDFQIEARYTNYQEL